MNRPAHRSSAPQAPASSRVSQAHLAAIVDSADDAIVSKDLRGIIRSWNRSAQRIFGYSAEEAIGQPVSMLIPPDREDEELQILARIQRGERVERLETVRVRKDGSLIDVAITVSPIRDDNGRIIGASKIARDISEQRVAEAALRASEKRYRQIAELLPGGVYVCDRRGRITFYNRRAAELWGREPGLGDDEELFCGSHRLWRTDGTELPRDQTPMALAVKTGRPARNEEVIIERPDGSRLNLSVCIDPIRDDNGDLQGAINIFQDISALKQAERAARKSESLLRAITDNSPLLLFAKDLQGRYIMANRGYLELFKTTREQLFGLTDQDRGCFNPEELRLLVENDRKVIETGQPHEFEESAVFNGETRNYISLKFPLFDEEGRVSGVCGLSTDITDQKRQQEQLRAQAEALQEADRRKDEFLSMLAHELRNPLAPVRNVVEVLKLQKRLSGDRLRWGVELIDRQVGQLARIVDDLLDISRINRGQVQVRKDTIDLRSVVEASCENARARAQSARQRVEVSLPKGPVLVSGDSARLMQVIDNILDNALKYTPEGGWIAIALEQQAGKARLLVRDSGVGIEPALLPHIFNLFSQGEQSLDRSKGGLGLGLTLVKRLVDLHGGTVHARSHGPGQGSEFIVCLPLEQPVSGDRAAGAQTAPGEDHALHVLLVEDNADVASSFSMLLEALGHEVRCASSGREALEFVAGQRPDVVLLDIGLPGMDGYETARRLRDKYPDLRLIAVTGYGRDEDRARSREAGFDEHLVKPADLRRLEEILLRPGLEPGTGPLH